MQAHAPLTVDQVGGGQPARFLYVFGCTAEECGKQPGCFRALRLTLASEASSSSAAGKVQEVQQQQRQQAAATTAAARPTDERRVSCAADDWGMGGAGDWGEAAESDSEAVAGISAAAFDFGDLNAALDAVGNAAVAAAPKRRQTSGGSSGSPGQPVYAAGQPCLPAFYLFAETEARCSKGSSSGGAGHEEDRLAALMAQYEAEAAAASDAAADAAPAPTAAALAAGVCSPGGGSGSGGGSEAAETWGGEGYEEDAVLAPAGARQRAAGAAYLKFSKQVARCPDQCARYRWVQLLGWTRGPLARRRCSRSHCAEAHCTLACTRAASVPKAIPPPGLTSILAPAAMVARQSGRLPSRLRRLRHAPPAARRACSSCS